MSDTPVFKIGKKAPADVRLGESDPYMSVVHVEATMIDGVLHVRDHGSTNGTFVNRRRVWDWAALHPDDRVTLGRTTLTGAELLDAIRTREQR